MSESFNDYFEENTQWVAGNSAAAPTAEPPRPPKSRKEMRKRRKKGKRKRLVIIISTLVIVALVATGCFFGYRRLAAWRAYNDNQQAISQDYPGPGTGTVWFTVDQGDDAVAIAKKLVKADVVKSQAAFTAVAMANSSTLYPGTYELKRHMAAADVIAILSDQTKATGFLDVKSGERVSAVIKEAAQLSGIDESEFQSVVDGGGSGILPAEANGKFEGWLEPGQYDVKSKKSASDILKMMVDKRIAKLDSLGVPTGSDRERILNIASIAEAEVNSKEYYGKVTRVILNRLDKNMTLGMDSTVAYGNDVEPAKITQAMLDDASNPYNTRINKGLPPTPISNPGDNAIKAALAPEDGNWLYFVTTNLETGETKFTDNETEFNQFVQEYKNNNKNAN
ncbi:endolytic transglycosylase MltG [Bifidobacterium sp. CP2]|uniref:endolytic transglycosylase MltG n=1 Tax=Bifidobacterium TaxID=1678 RepID=UPI001BDBD2DB|nr:MULTISPECIES: endolytic transglycosylase MltG [Bifidobacterium]MBT1181313.1 endolytic transglycosylase MltG [Bifidobacterium sp. CP2]MBW3080000.1 endolytic transglycosylase MltG [Bifidobacterium saguinibicoloris]